MANQIGKRQDEIVPRIANHIKKFWDQRMRRAIFAYLDSGGDGLDPQVKQAILLLHADAGNAAEHSTETGLQGT